MKPDEKKHVQFHHEQKDTWTWNTFAIETGDNAGMYITSSCGHAWKDFDEWEARIGKAYTADGAIGAAKRQQMQSRVRRVVGARGLFSEHQG